MKIPKTEREMAFEELKFQLKKFGNTLLATWLGKLLIFCVEGLNRLLTPLAVDGAEGCWLCGKPERDHPSAECMSFIRPATKA